MCLDFCATLAKVSLICLLSFAFLLFGSCSAVPQPLINTNRNPHIGMERAAGSEYPTSRTSPRVRSMHAFHCNPLRRLPNFSASLQFMSWNSLSQGHLRLNVCFCQSAHCSRIARLLFSSL